jgi:hypothetical protein
VPAAPTLRRSRRRLAPAATRRGAGQIGVPVIQADGWSAQGAKHALRRSPGRSSHCPPTPGGSPTVPAGDHLVVLRADCSPPELVAVHVGVPRAHSRRPRRRRAKGGRRWGA